MSAVASNPPAVPDRVMTAEEFGALTDIIEWELDDGRMVEKPMGTKSGWIGSQLMVLIGLFIREHPIGWVFNCEAMYKCYPGHPNRVRKPDLSFIVKGRLPGEQVPDPFILIPPDLAVEVMSPNDLASEIERKVREYIEAGVRLVWVIYPETRTLRIHRADGTIAQADERGTVSGEDVLPGFQFVVGDLFKPTV
jgi:Uma2 family endonuclease